LPQAIENVWLLSADCHAAKTLGKPSAAHWLERFVAHCRVFGYRHEESRAVDRLAFVRARSGEALKEATP
jgi:hypothetical protein